ncbi:MAG: hypothetical protein ACLFUH_03415 [Bacteroidales bacterium]
MKNFYILIILAALFSFLNISESKAQTGEELVDICKQIDDEVKYLKDFNIKLNSAPAGEDPPQHKKSIVLRKNTHYRFTICSSQDYPGEAIVKVYDSNKLIGSNYVVSTGKIHESFDFKCQKTGAYHLFVEFEDGKEGLAVVMLSFVEKL